MADQHPKRQCQKCEKYFVKGNFARHFQRCSREQPGLCPHCNQNWTKLNTHLRICRLIHNPTRLPQAEQQPASKCFLAYPKYESGAKLAHHKSAKEIVEGLLEYKTKYNEVLMTWISQRTWYHINSIPERFKALWLDFSLPRLIPTDECWYPSSSSQSRIPSASEAWEAATKELASAKSNQIYDVDEHLSSQWATVLAQIRPLSEEMETLQRNPLVALNINSTLENYEFRVPPVLERAFQVHPESLSFSLNATPAYALVDLHIDRGLDAISACIDARKVWFLWPPTQQNLTEIYRVSYQRNQRMVRSELNDGLIIETDSAMALHIPSGWLHATFTISGGFLAGVTVLTAESIKIISLIMQTELAKDIDDLSGNLRIYLQALEITLSSRNKTLIQGALDGWIQLESWLRQLEQTLAPKLRGAFTQAWDTLWEYDLKGWSCCELHFSTGNDFREHFQQEHLSFLQQGVQKREPRLKQKKKQS